MHVTFTAEAAVNKLLLLKQQYIPLLLLWLNITSMGIVSVTTSSSSKVMCHLATGIQSEKCVVRRFHYCANVIECTYTIWCEFDHASPLICGNKMPTRCNRWFLYRRSYCLLSMFREPLCPSSGAQEYYTGCVRFAGCCASHKTDTQPTAVHQTDNLKTNLYNTLELLMMGIMFPETCWASSKICNKETMCCI